MQVVKPGRSVIHPKIKSVGESVRDIRTTLCQAITPRAEVDLLHRAQMHIHAALSHAFAAHAGKVGLAADLEWKAAIEQVIPHVPLRDARRVHGADEIAHSRRRAHTNFHRPHAVHLRHREVRQLLGGAVVRRVQLRLAQRAVVVRVDGIEWERQQGLVALGAHQQSVLV